MAQVSLQAHNFYVCHLCGAKSSRRTKFPEFCHEFPFILCITSGILECWLNPSWLQLCKPMASSSSVYSSCSCCTISYFISLSDLETATQRKIIETKTPNKRKSHYKKKLAAHCGRFSCSQTALPAQRKWGVFTLKRNRPLLQSQGPLGFCWNSWFGLWRKTVGTFLPYLPPGQAQLSPLWVVFPVTEVLSFRFWCDPGVNWVH